MGCGASGDVRRAKPTVSGAPAQAKSAKNATGTTGTGASTKPLSGVNKPAGSLDYKLRVYSFNDIYTIDNL